jgi:hypothetical protein
MSFLRPYAWSWHCQHRQFALGRGEQIMKHLSLFPMLLTGLLVFGGRDLGADSPSLLVSNVRARQRVGTNLVDVWYDVAYAGTNQLYAAVAVSTNSGVTFDLPAAAFTPANGAVTTPGSNRRITWNAGADWNGKFSSQVKFRVTASDVFNNGVLTATCGTCLSENFCLPSIQGSEGDQFLFISKVSGGIPPYTCDWSITRGTNLLSTFTHTNIPSIKDSFTMVFPTAGNFIVTAQITDSGSEATTCASAVQIATSTEGEK